MGDRARAPGQVRGPYYVRAVNHDDFERWDYCITWVHIVVRYIDSLTSLNCCDLRYLLMDYVLMIEILQPLLKQAKREKWCRVRFRNMMKSHGSMAVSCWKQFCKLSHSLSVQLWCRLKCYNDIGHYANCECMSETLHKSLKRTNSNDPTTDQNDFKTPWGCWTAKLILTRWADVQFRSCPANEQPYKDL